MLPDYPELKRVYSRAIRSRVDAVVKSSSLLQNMRSMQLFEGDGPTQIERAGVRVSSDSVHSEAQTEIPVAELEKLSFDALVVRLCSSMGRDLAGQQERAFLDALSKAAEEGGNVFSAEGQPISAELLLDALERVELNFDGSGRPTHVFIGSPVQAPAYESALAQIRDDPKLRKRHDSIMSAQWERWRVREAARKLVG